MPSIDSQVIALYNLVVKSVKEIAIERKNPAEYGHGRILIHLLSGGSNNTFNCSNLFEQEKTRKVKAPPIVHRQSLYFDMSFAT